VTEQATQPASSPEQTTEAAARPRILAVDDSRVMRRAITKILGKDYDVIEAEHGEDAWTLLTHDDSIQVVFSDISMPYLDGFGLLERIRSAADERLKELPVVIVTGKEDDEASKNKALSMGATDFISKPFESVQLRARAQTHVRLERTSRKLSETEKTLEIEAAIDAVTGVGSKRYFMKAAGEVLAYVKRHGDELAVLRLDVDGFNGLFIKHGKDAANALLGGLGRLLLQQAREEDKVARLGLASFAFVLQNTTLEGAHKLAERVREQVEAAEFGPQTAPLKATVSVGLIQPAIDKDTTVDALLEAAQTQLTLAQRRGGNTVVGEPPSPPAVSAVTTPTPPPGLEQALKLLSEGRGDAVAAHATALMRQIMPVVELYLATQGETGAAQLAGLRQSLDR